MPTSQWLQHPVTVFALPLIILLCAPHLYELLLAGADPSYDEARLQNIANLMDNIYTTLANSTFIPHNAIRRGPHQINTTALRCKPHAAVLRLVNILPYVDTSLVQEPDWIYGGHFMDYRNPDQLAELCDPLRGQSIGWVDYLSPSDLALTNWGTGGWNNDRTWVMLYNTERDAIRIFDAEEWVGRHQAQEELGDAMNDWWFEDMGEYIWDRSDGASHILNAITSNYQSLKWTPWKTSNRENGFGVSPNTIKALLERNGWPDSFNPDQFRIDFIRAKHKPSGKGHAEAVLKRIDDLAGSNQAVVIEGTSTYDSPKGQIHWTQQRLRRHHEALSMTSDDDECALHEWRIQRIIWDIEDQQHELESARLDVAKLCPNGICVQQEDMILWELFALERTYEEARYTNYTQRCKHRLEVAPSKDAEWLEKCTANAASQNSRLTLAYEQSRAEALAHCNRTGCTTLQFPGIRERTNAQIEDLHLEISLAEARINKMHTEHEHKLPANAVSASEEFWRDSALLANGNRYLEAKIEELEQELHRLESGEWGSRGKSWLFAHLRSLEAEENEEED
ncbi:uncharacterized protein EKO05_0009911 [Ascochyta rabiei]|uniref:Uncharacterized protein n=1 Tax=Didymella rabiei TaxID=5454 RepID=A0A163MG97_DIDRA|nr:uncharacterized protein EKO05_0009911 [Ascochyta rabiei]KZM28690.1 hypothetical protein ST47_g155 [Ascochyta rabiei]UPX19656.1 hypothetical protein EKO05_0009911 [Ascochyta rabiei]